MGSPQQKPKYVKLLCDVSGSMYRFNGHDGRLEREMEAMLMVMEALENYEHKIKVGLLFTALDYIGDIPIFLLYSFFKEKHLLSMDMLTSNYEYWFPLVVFVVASIHQTLKPCFLNYFFCIPDGIIAYCY